MEIETKNGIKRVPEGWKQKQYFIISYIQGKVNDPGYKTAKKVEIPR